MKSHDLALPGGKRAMAQAALVGLAADALVALIAATRIGAEVIAPALVGVLTALIASVMLGVMMGLVPQRSRSWILVVCLLGLLYEGFTSRGHHWIEGARAAAIYVPPATVVLFMLVRRIRDVFADQY